MLRGCSRRGKSSTPAILNPGTSDGLGCVSRAGLSTKRPVEWPGSMADLHSQSLPRDLESVLVQSNPNECLAKLAFVPCDQIEVKHPKIGIRCPAEMMTAVGQACMMRLSRKPNQPRELSAASHRRQPGRPSSLSSPTGPARCSGLRPGHKQKCLQTPKFPSPVALHSIAHHHPETRRRVGSGDRAEYLLSLGLASSCDAPSIRCTIAP
jgi:hypothetical protein